MNNSLFLLQAIEFAARKHTDQRRKDEEASPYINHPVSVALLLAERGKGTTLKDVNKNKLLTIDDLITAFIEEAKFKDAHEDLRLYYKQRLDLLKKLFQCDLKKRQKELDQELNTRRQQRASRSTEKLYEISGSGAVTFFEHCIAAFNQTKSPFKMVVYLEGMPPKIVRKLEKEYGEKISAHEQELNRLNRLLIKEVLKYLFPGIEKKKITEAKLFEMGLPKEEPDPDDYW